MNERMKPRCRICGRNFGGHLALCPGEPVPIPEPVFRPETPDREKVPRVQLWALADAARVFWQRATGGRIGSTAYDSAAQNLELQIGRLPETVWKA